MGIVSGGVRIRRFQVLGEPPEDFQGPFEEGIERYAFRDFAEGDEQEQVLGWVGADDWFVPGLPPERWLVGRSVLLTLRVDTKRIPARFLKQECRKLEAEWKLRSGREELTRAERDEIVAIVRKRLLDRAIPSCQGHDVCWELERGEVLLWSTSAKVGETFRVLFEKTFGLKLRPLFPYALALRQGADPEVLDRAVPASFRQEVR
ncbi:MAG: recombination-associated protein RdgC [Deferrisomatales bacterium]